MSIYSQRNISRSCFSSYICIDCTVVKQGSTICCWQNIVNNFFAQDKLSLEVKPELYHLPSSVSLVFLSNLWHLLKVAIYWLTSAGVQLYPLHFHHLQKQPDFSPPVTSWTLLDWANFSPSRAHLSLPAFFAINVHFLNEKFVTTIPFVLCDICISEKGDVWR